VTTSSYPIATATQTTSASGNCPEGNGWYFNPNDPNLRAIQLCATTCNMVRQDPSAVVEILAGCGGPIIISDFAMFLGGAATEPLSMRLAQRAAVDMRGNSSA
jgi:hypothetical protein